MREQAPRFPNKSLILGIASLLLGGVLLLWRLGFMPNLESLWPLPFLVLGLYFLYMLFMRNRSRRYMLPGILFSLGGIFFLLKNSVMPDVRLSQVWPAFMLITGFSILPYGFRQKRNTRIAIVIPALTIIGLAVIFFPFSLGLVDVRFTDFVLTWWPALFILIGALLILSYLMQKKS
ncbi:MAG TPA: hypothetical protein VMX75_11740 [Spirochaetia bacterium]|nr:hypothetical protein [Spirochaetia bacterium]